MKMPMLFTTNSHDNISINYSLACLSLCHCDIVTGGVLVKLQKEKHPCFFTCNGGARGSVTMTQCHNRIVAGSLNLNRTIDVQQGLDYLLSQFANSDQGIFPRTIATKMTEGRQVLVSNMQEALTWFGLADWLDCRISAYSYWKPSAVSRFIGIKNPIPPDLVMIDLDMCNFGFDERLLKTALRKVLLKI